MVQYTLESLKSAIVTMHGQTHVLYLLQVLVDVLDAVAGDHYQVAHHDKGTMLWPQKYEYSLGQLEVADRTANRQIKQGHVVCMNGA